MTVLRSVQLRLIEGQRRNSGATLADVGRPAMWRRAIAATIDRLLPLPFLGFFFPQWAALVFLYHLLCDSSPERRSFGKWLCRLRVVSSATGQKCNWWQAALRRSGSALAQVGWCLAWRQPQWLTAVLVYELASAACVMVGARGQRPEDWLAGTRVMSERSYRQWRRGRQTD
ncbi:MAG TPA: RDD family protein [Blastocatellia bacterium]|nr:RDD family protein [Blastocatellia bacterium]